MHPHRGKPRFPHQDVRLLWPWWYVPELSFQLQHPVTSCKPATSCNSEMEDPKTEAENIPELGWVIRSESFPVFRHVTMSNLVPSWNSVLDFYLHWWYCRYCLVFILLKPLTQKLQKGPGESWADLQRKSKATEPWNLDPTWPLPVG